jgi:hypothetical protein
MKARSHRVGILAVFALAAATLPFPVAQARVDFERETHFRCYNISQQTPEAARTVTLSDQFMADVTETPDEPVLFCVPTSKDGLPIRAPEEHLTFYEAPERLVPHLNIFTEDQFGARTLRAISAHYLLVPTEKEELGFPRRLNHYWCYDTTGPKVGQTVTLDDQFGSDTVRVEKPRLFCNPVEKIHAGRRTRIVEREVHLTCYDIFGPQATEATQFRASNQFETDMFTVTSWDLLCVQSEKTGFQPAS